MNMLVSGVSLMIHQGAFSAQGLLSPSVMCMCVKGDMWPTLRLSKFRQEHYKKVMKGLFAQFPSKLFCIIQ